MSNLKVVIFDLDDTLYPELDYVKSGLKFVAKNISADLNIGTDKLFNKLISSLKQGRSEIFNRVLNELGILSPSLLKRCIGLYRQHKPNIALSTEVTRLISCLSKQYNLYIVTDGHKLVQEKKLRALGLYDSDLIKKCFITYRYGLKHAKPSAYCFNKIAALENVKANQVIYIADNAKKDFVGIKPLGFHTLRIRTGQHINKFYGASHEADNVVDALSQVDSVLELFKD